METQIILGKNLSEEYISIMINQRLHEYGENRKDFKNNEKESIFFFIKEKKEIKAFGFLKPIKIELNKETFHILGIGNIIAREKGKGYGKILITQIINYLKTHKKTGLGFCAKDKSKFYKKCDLTIIEDMSLRFRYKHATQKEIQEELEDPGDGLYYNGKDQFLTKFLKTKSLAYIEVNFW